jgi:hypothetical protein
MVSEYIQVINITDLHDEFFHTVHNIFVVLRHENQAIMYTIP